MLKLGVRLARETSRWLLAWADRADPPPKSPPEEPDDGATLAQRPLTQESLDMLAGFPRPAKRAPPPKPLEGSAAARYARARR